MLGSMLEHARPLSVEQGTLSLGFLRGDLYVQSVASERQTLEPLLSEAWGAPLRLAVVELDPEAGAQISSLAESADRAEREAREERLRAGREHPSVVRAAALLGADIEEVRDLGGVMP